MTSLDGKVAVVTGGARGQVLSTVMPWVVRTWNDNDRTNLLDVQMVEPADITNAVMWLISDRARYVTGIDLPVDAGYRTKH